MFNDISCDRKSNKDECLATARVVKVLAKKFGIGQWSFSVQVLKRSGIWRREQSTKCLGSYHGRNAVGIRRKRTSYFCKEYSSYNRKLATETIHFFWVWVSSLVIHVHVRFSLRSLLSSFISTCRSLSSSFPPFYTSSSMLSSTTWSPHKRIDWFQNALNNRKLANYLEISNRTNKF